MSLRLLGPDQSTVLFDFDSVTGSGNPNTMITNLQAGIDFGTVTPELRLAMLEAGANLQGLDLPPVEMAFSFTGSTASINGLWAGLGQLGRFLLSATPEHPIFLEWDELPAIYYYDVIGLVRAPQLYRGQATGAIITARKNTVGPIEIVLLRQPWRRGATVTTSAEVVEGDPATGTPDQSRLATFTVTGDLPTPCKVRAQANTGATVAKLLVGHRYQGSRAATYLTDYRDETSWFQAEASGRGWTVTLGTDTSATTDGALASPGSGNVVAQVASAGSSVGVMSRRVRATRTTLMDSLRGSSVPSVRFRASAASVWEIKVGWGPSTGDPVPFFEDTYTHDVSTATSFVYVEPFLGRIDLPQQVALSGMAVEVWARRVSGTGFLNIDLGYLWPAEGLAAINVPPGSTQTVLGRELVSPVASPAGGTAGVPSSPPSTWIALDTTTDNAGTVPAVLPAGRYRITFNIPNGSGTIKLAVRNVTGATDAVSRTDTIDINNPNAHVLEFTADGTSTYHFYVDDPNATTDRIGYITWEYLPALVANESVRTDPGPVRYAVDKLDSSGNLSGYLEAEGEVPIMGRPGDNQLVLRADEVKAFGYAEAENKLARDLTVTVVFDPRYIA